MGSQWRGAGWALLVLGFLSAVWWLADAQTSATDSEIRRVYVTNFPGRQEIEGRVRIQGPLPATNFSVVQDAIVTPVVPSDTMHLIPGGTITTEGFSQVVLSLNGITKGTILRPGQVGALLIPDVPSAVEAFEQEGQLQFALEVSTPNLGSKSERFFSPSPRFSLAFPRYRVFFFNTTDKSVSVNLFVNLVL